MKEAIEAAWTKFFGTGWEYGKEPSKSDCFEAGYKAALDVIASEKKEAKE